MDHCKIMESWSIKNGETTFSSVKNLSLNRIENAVSQRSCSTPTLTAQGIFVGGDVPKMENEKKETNSGDYIPKKEESSAEMTAKLLEQITKEGGNCESPLEETEKYIGTYKDRVGRYRWRPAVARKRAPNVVIDRSSGMLVDDGDTIEFPPPSSRTDPILKESTATFQLLEHVWIQQKDDTTKDSTRNHTNSSQETPQSVIRTVLRSSQNFGSDSPTVEHSITMISSPKLQNQLLPPRSKTLLSPNIGKKLPFQSYHRLRAVTPQGNAVPLQKRSRRRSQRNKKLYLMSPPSDATCGESDLVIDKTSTFAKPTRKATTYEIRSRQKRKLLSGAEFRTPHSSARKTLPPKGWIPNAAPSESDEESDEEMDSISVRRSPRLQKKAKIKEPHSAVTPSPRQRTSPGKNKFNEIAEGWPSLKKRMLNDGSVQRMQKPSSEIFATPTLNPNRATIHTKSQSKRRSPTPSLPPNEFPKSDTPWEEFKKKCQMMFPHMKNFMGKLQFIRLMSEHSDDRFLLPFQYSQDDFCIVYHQSGFESNVSDEQSMMGFVQREPNWYHYFQFFCNKTLVGVVRICGDGRVAEIIEYWENSKPIMLMELIVDFIELFEPRVYYFYDKDKGYPIDNKMGVKKGAWGNFERFYSANLKNHWETHFGFQLSTFEGWLKINSLRGPSYFSQNPKQVEFNIHKLRNWALSDIKQWMRPEVFRKIERIWHAYSSKNFKRIVRFKFNHQFIHKSRCGSQNIHTVYDLFQRVIKAHLDGAPEAAKQMNVLYLLLLTHRGNFKGRVLRKIPEKACRYERILQELDRARVYEHRFQR